MEELYCISWYLMGSAIAIMATAYGLKNLINKQRRYWSSYKSKRFKLALKILDGMWITFSVGGVLGFLIILIY